MNIVRGNHQIGTIGDYPAMFADGERGLLQADTETLLRWVTRINGHGLGARPESCEFIVACNREECTGTIENRAAHGRRREVWLTDLGRAVLADLERKENVT